MNPEGLRSAFTSTTGGVMTVEAGAITGELELCTRPDGEAFEVLVRYAGAEEWYAVEGSPVPLESETTPRAAHERIVGHLTTPGRKVGGNEEPVSLTSFSAAL